MNTHPVNEANGLDALRILASRLKTDSRFMASALEEYARLWELDNERLARQLGIASELLIRLALCRCPDTSSPTFFDEIEDLSNYTLVSRSRLLQVIEAVKKQIAKPASANI